MGANDGGNGLVQPITLRELYRGRYKNGRTVGTIELGAITTGEAGGCAQRSRGTESVSKR